MRRTAAVLCGLVLVLVTAGAQPAGAHPAGDALHSVESLAFGDLVVLAGPGGEQPPMRVDDAPALPLTGRAIPILAAGIAIGVALLLRAGASRLSDHEADPDADPEDLPLP